MLDPKSHWKESQSKTITIYLDSSDGKLSTIQLYTNSSRISLSLSGLACPPESITLKTIIEMAHQGHYGNTVSLSAEQVLDVYYLANRFGFLSCMTSAYPILRHHIDTNPCTALRAIQLFHDRESIPFQEELLHTAISAISPIESICRPGTITTTSTTTSGTLDSIKYSPLNVRTITIIIPIVYLYTHT